MSRYDLIRIAFKTLKGRWAAIPVALVVISMFCLCYAGAVFTTVNGEKSKPYEASVSAGSSKLTDESLVKVSKINGVSAVTPVIEVPVKISVGEYSAHLTLYGVNASYLKGGFEQGAVFQDSSVMPYIVLNKAACKRFSKAKDTYTSGDTGDGDMAGDTSDKDTAGDTSSKDTAGSTSGKDTAGSTSNTDTSGDTNDTDTGDENGGDSTATAAPEIGWLKTQATIVSGRGKVTVKICGILSADDKNTEPAGYISISSAKQLLAQSGESTDYTGAKARVENMGFAEDVSTSVKALGLSVENTNEELQSKWDRESDEASFLTVTGVIGLLCFVVLIIALKKISLLEFKESWAAFKWAGFRDRDINSVFLFRSLLISIAGIVIGLIIALSLPSFLPSKLQGKSIMMFNVPFGAAAISAAICIAAGLLPSINRTGRV